MVKVMQQFSIYLPNKPGELKRLLFKVKKLNMSAAATFASKDGAIMRLVPRDAGSFQNIMRQNNITFNKQDIILVSVRDEAGGLLPILAKLQEAHVNIEGLYIVGDGGDNIANCVIQPDDVHKAKAALER